MRLAQKPRPECLLPTCETSVVAEGNAAQKCLAAQPCFLLLPGWFALSLCRFLFVLLTQRCSRKESLNAGQLQQCHSERPGRWVHSHSLAANTLHIFTWAPQALRTAFFSVMCWATNKTWKPCSSEIHGDLENNKMTVYLFFFFLFFSCCLLFRKQQSSYNYSRDILVFPVPQTADYFERTRKNSWTLNNKQTDKQLTFTFIFLQG